MIQTFGACVWAIACVRAGDTLPQAAPELKKVPSFKTVDRDGNGKLIPAEVSVLDDSSGARRRFFAMDADADGTLSEEEWTRQGRDVPVLAVNLFRGHDGNGDGSVSGEEWLAGVGADKVPQAQYEFALCDFDGDGLLSLGEYTCLPSVGSGHQRGPVPDPIVQEVGRLAGLVAQRLGDGGSPTGETAGWVAELVSGVTQRDVQSWDGDHDGSLTHREIRRGLEVAYGVRHPSGARMRRENGETFDWRTFRSYDKDGDGMLSSEEFTQRYWGGSEKARALLAGADGDQDGRLTVSELEGGTLLWLDTFDTFGRFDSDQSGTIDADELSSQSKSWEKSYVAMAFPAFDADGNGVLSFLEFRVTPLSNSLADWNTTRSDRDFDGLLSLDEFHDDSSPALKGLSAVFLKRLDKDGDNVLSVGEFAFQVDLRHVSVEVAFAILDADSDACLALTEAIEYGRPTATDAATHRRHEEKIMRIEDAFRVADKDRSGDLSVNEFGASETTVAAVITGRPSDARTARRSFRQTQAGVEPEAWNWRFAAIVVFNVILLAGLAWLALRSPAGK